MELTLISCNIRFDNPADGAHSWHHRRNLLSETLLKHSPDIIATQEGRYDQLKDFETLLKDYFLIDDHRSWIKERMYPTLFLKKDSFELLKSEDLWLSETPDVAGSRSFESAFPRLMTWASIQPKNLNKRLLIVNTHLDHVKSETREAQARVLAQEIKRIRQGQQTLAILGDFNESPQSPVQNLLKKEIPGLIDTWALFNKTEESSHHAFKGLMPEGSRIDWILIEGESEILQCRMDKTCREGRWPSDHFPIICKINV